MGFNSGFKGLNTGRRGEAKGKLKVLGGISRLRNFIIC